MICEIARDLYTLPGVFGELAFWQARAWGMTERDIHATFATAGLGALAIATFADGRASPGLFAFALPVAAIDRFLLWAERTSVRIHGKGWFKVIRGGVLTVWLVIGVLLLWSIPSVHSQDGITTREVIQDHEERLRGFAREIQTMTQAQADIITRLVRLERQQEKLVELSERVFSWFIGGGLVWGVKALIWDTFAAGAKARLAAVRQTQPRRKEEEE
ncbi:MAG: hypothetical protein IT163_06315 [Bryobacterales bacterium]|nr:hypothetical protein [Bryobacterales bacterium]